MRLPRLTIASIGFFGVSVHAHAQGTSAREMQWCSAMICEEMVIRAVALDSAIRHLKADQPPRARPLRILATVYSDPFRVRSSALPVARLGISDWTFLRRIYPDLTIVDSAGAAFSRDGVLSAGGPLFVVAPVSWRGDSAAVVRLASFPAPGAHSSELYVRLEYRAKRWAVVRIEYGWQE